MHCTCSSVLLIQGDHNSSTQIPEISVVLLKSPEFPLKKYGHPYPENKAIFFEERFKTKSFRLRRLFKTSFRLLVLFKRNSQSHTNSEYFRGKIRRHGQPAHMQKSANLDMDCLQLLNLLLSLNFNSMGLRKEYFVSYTVSISYLRQISLFNTSFFIARALSATSMRVRKCKVVDNAL